MAEEKRPLAVQYSILAKARLAEIWQHSAERYGEAHATRYIGLLIKRTHGLELGYLRGREVPNRPSYRYITFKTRARGHGYVVVYQIRHDDLFVFCYLHTAQDWLRQLQSPLPKE